MHVSRLLAKSLAALGAESEETPTPT